MGVKAGEERQQGGLPGAGAADDGDMLAGFCTVRVMSCSTGV
jgi:hypothetical protein